MQQEDQISTLWREKTGKTEAGITGPAFSAADAVREQLGPFAQPADYGSGQPRHPEPVISGPGLMKCAGGIFGRLAGRLVQSLGNRTPEKSAAYFSGNMYL